MDAAIDHAKKGDLKFFKEAPVDILLNPRDSDGGTVLSLVVNGNYVDCCKEICKRCPSLLFSQHYQGRDTPLHVAAYRGYLDILKILISTCDKADLENQHDIEDQGGDRVGQQKTLMSRTTTSDGDNAMHKAVHGGKLESIKLLIEADPNNKLLRAGDNQNNTPLHLAVETNQLEIARLLIEADPDFLYGVNLVGKTPILIAIEKAELHNDGEMLKFILERQPTQSYKVKVNENGWSALHYSVSQGFLHSIGSIIRSCPDSSKVPDNEGQNFFQFAVKLGSVEMVKRILNMNDITEEVLNSTDKTGRTPFNVAAESQNESMIECLSHDHRVNTKLTATKNLNWLVEKHNTEIMRSLVFYNHDILKNIEEEVFLNSINEENETILFKAGQEEKIFLCKKLCERCPLLIIRTNKVGQTALHQAAWRGSFQVLRVLIEACYSRLLEHMDVKNPFYNVDDQGDTALHKAVLNSQFGAVNLLVEADPDYKYRENNFGNTPITLSIDIARSKENKYHSGEIRQLLFKMQPRQTMAWRGWENRGTLLHKATSEEDLSCIEDIINFCTGYLDVVDDNGKNFLHIAAELGKIGVVQLVLEAKDIPNAVFYHQDKDGNTPMHIAAKTENKSLMGCFLSDLRLIKIMPHSHREENSWRLLHHAASDGNLGIIKDIIKWTNYLDWEDHEGKNFLHIAAEFEKVEVVKMILRDKDIPEDGVLNKKDNDGNTPFHSAALTGNEPLTRCFLFNESVNKDTTNKKGQKPLNVIKFSYDKRKAGVDRIAHTVDQSELKDQSDFDLVVAALIATVSFAAGITVPGGYISDGPNQGTAVFSKRVSFASFTISNTFALVFSLFAVFSHFCARRLSDDADIIYQLKVATYCTLAAMGCMMVAFIGGSFAVLANSNWLAIVVCIISCPIFIFAFHPMRKIAKQRKLAASAGQHKRCNCKCFGFF